MPLADGGVLRIQILRAAHGYGAFPMIQGGAFLRMTPLGREGALTGCRQTPGRFGHRSFGWRTGWGAFPTVGGGAFLRMTR